MGLPKEYYEQYETLSLGGYTAVVCIEFYYNWLLFLGMRVFEVAD